MPLITVQSGCTVVQSDNATDREPRADRIRRGSNSGGDSTWAVHVARGGTFILTDNDSNGSNYTV